MPTKSAGRRITPAYGTEFYQLYLGYLQEPTVRANHDMMFETFYRFTRPTQLRIMDLGCGLGEYSRYGPHSEYVGIDLNNAGQVKNFVHMDYTELNLASHLPFVPNAFVSLFSIEACYPAKSKYALYERIFAENPSIRYGLVSGFFYESRRGLETVSEAGKIVSYQTIEDQSKYVSGNFSEVRVYLRTPSKMFGDDPVEVWKMLAR